MGLPATLKKFHLLGLAPGFLKSVRPPGSSNTKMNKRKLLSLPVLPSLQTPQPFSTFLSLQDEPLFSGPGAHLWDNSLLIDLCVHLCTLLHICLCTRLNITYACLKLLNRHPKGAKSH